ncbi:MAG TPA: DUF2231 domain-containing protein [Candidatus Binataceae bacterium]|nr:DUF2231 domain-containing protein [Candidatus Binataceae bacterium]
MDSFLSYLQQLDLHPVADHFTIGVLAIAVLIDLVASLAPARAWIRYTALTLMIIGAVAAGASYATGDMEADRIWKALAPEVREVLHRHAQIGEYLAVAFAILAVWRILIESLGFMSGSRPVYLIVALVAVGTLFYVGHLGGKLVYTYGAGTALTAAQAVTSESASPAGTPTPASALPTVTVPTAMPMIPAPPPATSTPAPEPSAATTPEAHAKPAQSPPPNPPAAPSTSPTASKI